MYILSPTRHPKCLTDGINLKTTRTGTYWHLETYLSDFHRTSLTATATTDAAASSSSSSSSFCFVFVVAIIEIEFSLLKCSFNNTVPTVKYKNNYINNVFIAM